MVKSKTKIDKQSLKKTSTEIVETIRAAKKNKAWLKVAEVLSSSRKNHAQVNLSEIKEDSVIPGKVLSQGDAGKHRIVAFRFSEKAKEKILKAGGKSISILDEIKSNPSMKNLKIIKGDKK